MPGPEPPRRAQRGTRDGRATIHVCDGSRNGMTEGIIVMAGIGAIAAAAARGLKTFRASGAPAPAVLLRS
jgi:hypothetical protein